MRHISPERYVIEPFYFIATLVHKKGDPENSSKAIHRKQFIESNSPKAIDRTESLSNGKFIERKIYRTENLSNGKFIERKIHRTENSFERKIYRTENSSNGKLIERKIHRTENLSNSN